ncbi:MAG: hypothetical protein H7293_01225 [Candidatus Saccharibacteria bacterium]|nr:hypothetical protein [Rhodoferax sp.]
MLHPIFNLIATQPQLLGQHAQAYGELLGAELSSQAAFWSRRAILGALAVCLMVVSLALAGVALMLWSAIVPEPRTALWVLLAVPATPAIAALLCFGLARHRSAQDTQAFAELRQQMQADMALLREINAS